MSVWELVGEDNALPNWPVPYEIAWAEFGDSDDHIVPEPGDAEETAWIYDAACSHSAHHDSSSARSKGAWQVSPKSDGRTCRQNFDVKEESCIESSISRTQNSAETWGGLCSEVLTDSSNDPFRKSVNTSVSDQLLAESQNRGSSSKRGLKSRIVTADDGGQLPAEAAYDGEDASIVNVSCHFSLADMGTTSGEINTLRDEPEVDKEESMLDCNWENIDNLGDVDTIFQTGDSSFEQGIQSNTDTFDWTPSPDEQGSPGSGNQVEKPHAPRSVLQHQRIASQQEAMSAFCQRKTAEVIREVEEGPATLLSVPTSMLEEETLTICQENDKVATVHHQAVQRKKSEEKSKRQLSHRRMQHGSSSTTTQAAGTMTKTFTPSPLLHPSSSSALQGCPSLLPSSSQTCLGERYPLPQFLPQLPLTQTGFRPLSRPIPFLSPMQIPQPQLMVYGYEQPSLQLPFEQKQQLHAWPLEVPQRATASTAVNAAKERMGTLEWHQQASLLVEQQDVLHKLGNQHQHQHFREQLPQGQEIPTIFVGPTSSVLAPGIDHDSDALCARTLSGQALVPGEEKTSTDATILQQLERTAFKLDIRTRLCIRDALYRLARSAMQRHAMGETHSSSGGSNELENTAAGLESSSGSDPSNVPRSSRFPGINVVETETNPIDRSIAYLLFHKRSQSQLSDPVFLQYPPPSTSFHATPQPIAGFESQLQWGHLTSEYITSGSPSAATVSISASGPDLVPPIDAIVSIQAGSAQPLLNSHRSNEAPTVFFDHHASSSPLSRRTNTSHGVASIGPGSQGVVKITTSVHESSENDALANSRQNLEACNSPTTYEDFQLESWTLRNTSMLHFGERNQDLKGCVFDLASGTQSSSSERGDKVILGECALNVDSILLDRAASGCHAINPPHCQDAVAHFLSQKVQGEDGNGELLGISPEDGSSLRRQEMFRKLVQSQEQQKEGVE